MAKVFLILGYIALGIFLIAVTWLVMSYLLGYHTQITFGQQQTKTPPITPVPASTPTPTQPNPNFQYLPQKAAVQVYTPEVGIPLNPQPLLPVPQVVPQQVAPVQSGTLGIPGLDLALLGGLVAQFIRTEMKNKTVTGIIKKIAGTQVKTIEATEEHLGLTMEQMPQKGNEITNKPNIKQQHIKEIKEEALDTAEKA